MTKLSHLFKRNKDDATYVSNIQDHILIILRPYFTGENVFRKLIISASVYFSLTNIWFYNYELALYIVMISNKKNIIFFLNFSVFLQQSASPL